MLLKHRVAVPYIREAAFSLAGARFSARLLAALGAPVKLAVMSAVSQTTVERTLELFRRLVALNTTSNRPNAPAADLLADRLESAGCRIARFEEAEGAKVNLVVAKGPDVEGGLLLSGHLDVVPAEELDWKSDPFELTERGDAYFARGSADMKGFVSIAADILANADAASLRRPLVGLFTHDEEVGTVGAQIFVRQWDKRWQLPTAAIIGEPTSLRVVRMHKGHAAVRITVRGRSAHSGYPQLGDNAIERLGRVIGVLTRLRQEWESARVETSAYFPETPYPVLNQALIEAGAALNIVPERAVLRCGIRVLPGQRAMDFIGRLRETLASSEDGEAVQVEVTNDSPPLLTAGDSPVHAALKRHLKRSDDLAVSYASDAGPLAALGLESVLYGPGDIAVAHKPNEFVPAAELWTARQELEAFAMRWCRADGDE